MQPVVKGLVRFGKFLADPVVDRPEIYHFRLLTSTDGKNVEQVLSKLRRVRQAQGKVIALSINMAGGNVAQSNSLHDAFLETSEYLRAPLYTFAEDFALKEGYKILTAGEKIYANPYSIIGDIGVTRFHLNFSEFLHKYICDFEALGEQPQRINAQFPVSNEQKKIYEEHLQKVLEEFKKLVISRRKKCFDHKGLKETDLIVGKSLNAKQALEAGLVDEIGTFEDLHATYYPNHKITSFSSSLDQNKRNLSQLQFSTIMSFLNDIENITSSDFTSESIQQAQIAKFLEQKANDPGFIRDLEEILLNKYHENILSQLNNINSHI